MMSDYSSGRVKQAKQGELGAYKILIKQFQQVIYGLGYRLNSDPQAAADLSRETLIRGYLNLNGFVDGYDFSSWLRKEVRWTNDSFWTSFPKK